MKKALFALAALSALNVAAPAFADDAASQPAAVEQQAVRVREGQTIYTADGNRLGSVSRITERGTVIVTASGGRFVAVQPATLSRQDGKVVTSLTREQLLASN